MKDAMSNRKRRGWLSGGNIKAQIKIIHMLCEVMLVMLYEMRSICYAN